MAAYITVLNCVCCVVYITYDMILCVFYYNVLSCVAVVRTIADCRPTLQRSVCNCNKNIIIIIIIIIVVVVVVRRWLK